MNFYDKNELNVRYIDFKDKNAITRHHIETMLNRTFSMFEWKNLPTTIPQRVLEYQLQVNGSTTIFEFEGNIYAGFGQIGGELNYNYLPSISIVSNPHIKNFDSKSMKIYYGKDNPISAGNIIKTDLDCVVIQNDALYQGIIPICNYYASLLTENMLTHRTLLINSRAMNLFIAGDDNAKQDYIDYMKALENGDLKAIMGKNFVFETKSLPFSTTTSDKKLTDLIESTQYIKASWFNDLGLQANYNMKREAINSNESQLNKDAILPLCDTMLAMRKKGCELVNELYGTKWEVDFSSAWKYTRDTIEQAIDSLDETTDMKMTVEDEVQQVEQEEDGGEKNE